MLKIESIHLINDEIIIAVVPASVMHMPVIRKVVLPQMILVIEGSIEQI